MAQEHEEQRSKRDIGRLVRHGSALVLVLVAAGAYILSVLSGELQVCQDAAVQVGPRPIVEQCKPLSLMDLVPVLLIAVVLLLPEIAEVSLPGLASITFRLQQQEDRQHALERQFAALMQSTQVNQETNVSAPNVIVVDTAGVQEALTQKLAHFAEAEERGEHPTPMAGEAPEISGEAEVRRAMLAQEVLHLWSERMEPWVGIGSRLGSRLWRGLLRGQVNGTLSEASQQRYGGRLKRLVPEGLSARDLVLVHDWHETFRQEIELVRGTRNAVAHPGQIGSPDIVTLERTLDIGNRIVALLEQELELQVNGNKSTSATSADGSRAPVGRPTAADGPTTASH